MQLNRPAVGFLIFNRCFRLVLFHRDTIWFQTKQKKIKNKNEMNLTDHWNNQKRYYCMAS